MIRKYDEVKILSESYLLDANEKPVGLKVGEIGKVMDVKENTDGVSVYMVSRLRAESEDEIKFPRIIQYPYYTSDLEVTKESIHHNTLRCFDMISAPANITYLDEELFEPYSEAYSDKDISGIIISKQVIGRFGFTYIVDTINGNRVYISDKDADNVKILDHCYCPVELLFKCKGLIKNNPV